MAATDKHYRDQNALDIVFALSSIAMFVSLILMLVQDYNREYKTEQRAFRDVEVAVAQRAALDKLPDAREFDEARKQVERARKLRTEDGINAEMKAIKSKLSETEQQFEDKKAALGKLSKAEQGSKKGQELKAEVGELESQLFYQQHQVQDLERWRTVVQEVEAKRALVKSKLPERDRREARFQTVKSDLESRASFYDIEVDHHGPGTATAKRYRADIDELSTRLAEVKAERDEVLREIKEANAVIEEYEAPLGKATTLLKKLDDQLDAQIKTAVNKTWGVADWVRDWPILDAFAAPVKIYQYVIDTVPIDYNFKYATRFDRCASCHLGIAREDFSRENILALRGVTNDQDRKLGDARKILKERRATLSGLPEASGVPDPDKLKLLTLSPSELTDARVTEFCAHPRLDLFVGPTSKHPAEKFGCTSCHSGQGSSTSFTLASHTPNNADQKRHWGKKYDWESNHFWDFPMLPNRFMESACLKCHHQVTDLVSSDNRVEAPKLLRGYNIIKDVGCFGCHEISGRKGGRPVGPDLRLESVPPLEDMTPGQRARIESDPDTAPGKLRKVGPSLFRLSEKTNEEFVRRWIRSPRDFRPDTKMPHYYGLANNNDDVLPADQKAFPNTEIYAITHFLFGASKGYLNELKEIKAGKDESAAADAAYQRFLSDFIDGRGFMSEELLDKLMPLAEKVEWSTLPKKEAAGKKWSGMIRDQLTVYGGRLPADVNKDITKTLEQELNHVRRRIKMRTTIPLLADLSTDPADPKKALKGDAKHGRQLFMERGCMACHVHDGTATPVGAAGAKDYLPAFSYDSEFGPNLSQVVDKLGTKTGDRESARIWLVQWLINPNVHNPRTRMPDTHLSRQEATDIAAWLLSEKASDLGPGWPGIRVEQPKLEDVQNLARVYLVRILSKTEMEKLLADKDISDEQIKELPAEEKELALRFANERKARERRAKEGAAAKDDEAAFREGALLNYVGKKAVNRMGCFGCHDIPGFENAKSIGVGLNDWGKKNPERLAFEDIKSYVEHHFDIVDNLVGDDGKPVAPLVKDGHKKMPYEEYFADLLFHHTREGFLNQKLVEPRSYDHNRLRAWDDRLRMPQFKFAKFRLPAAMKADRALQQSLSAFVEAGANVTVRKISKLIESLPDAPALQDLKKKAGAAGEVVFDDAVGGDEDKALGSVKLSPDNKRKVDDVLSAAKESLVAVNARLPKAGDLEAQANLQEAKASEAVETFILGLIAEPVPLAAVNQPKGDRLAEVKGRELLERFNCQSCHLVRPGYFEFKATDQVKKFLDKVEAAYVKSASTTYFHPEHYFWSGKDPKNGTFKAMVNWPAFDPDKKDKAVFPLLQALRYVGADRGLHDIGTLQDLTIDTDFGVRPQDMVTPPPATFSSPDRVKDYLHTHGPFGGTFGDALAAYLVDKTQKAPTPMNPKNARSSTPPWLTAEGERTQPDWLYQFLLNPQPIRKMVILRMPKFNLSDEDAKTLTEYFAAVERINDPDIGLAAPFDKIRQREEFDAEFWKEKNREYVQRLMRTKVAGPDGKETKETWYAKRVGELTPVWAEMVKEHERRKATAAERAKTAEADFSAISKDYDPLAENAKKLETDLEGLKGKLAEAKADKAKLKELEGQVAAADAKLKEVQVKLAGMRPDYDAKQRVFDSWKAELDRASKEDDKYKPGALEKDWAESQAYVTDAYRLLFHKQLCSQCHPVGNREAPSAVGGTPGPSLNDAFKRLRPDWIERWVSNPSYFLHYTPMPVNFKKGEDSYQELFVGSSLDQIKAVRDVLMAYPQASALPLNRYWVLPPALETKAAAPATKKGPEEKSKEKK